MRPRAAAAGRPARAPPRSAGGPAGVGRRQVAARRPRADADGHGASMAARRDGARRDGHGATACRACGARPWPGSGRWRRSSAWTIWFLNSVRGELRLLLGVAEERHLDQHRRHVGADQHAERRLLDRARRSSRRARAAPPRRCRRSAADSSRCRAWAISQRISSMSREPPPSDGSGRALRDSRPAAAPRRRSRRG